MGSVRRPFYSTVDKETREKVRKQSRVWWVRYSRGGRRFEESSGSTKKGDAARLLKLREGAIARGEPVTAALGRLRFEDAAAQVLNDYRSNGRRSLAGVERRLKLHLEPYFGGRRAASITTADLRSYATRRQEQGASNGSINRELAIVRRALRLGKEDGRLLHVPHFPMLREADPRSGFFERDEFEDVRARLPEHLRGVVTFAYLCGWRVPSEILTLQWSQVDLKAKTMRLEPGTTKNAKPREITYDLLPELVDVVEHQWEEHQALAARGVLCPFVFHHNGRPIKSYRGAWRRACEEAGIPGRIPHDFRRTSARNLIRAGVSENVAMQITGHLTPSVFRRYDITVQKDVREGLGKLAAAATGKEKGKIAGSGRVRRFHES